MQRYFFDFADNKHPDREGSIAPSSHCKDGGTGALTDMLKDEAGDGKTNARLEAPISDDGGRRWRRRVLMSKRKIRPLRGLASALAANARLKAVATSPPQSPLSLRRDAASHRRC